MFQIEKENDAYETYYREKIVSVCLWTVYLLILYVFWLTEVIKLGVCLFRYSSWIQPDFDADQFFANHYVCHCRQLICQPQTFSADVNIKQY